MRIATFNLENLDINESLEDRIKVLRPQLQRLQANVVFLQEIHSQENDDVRSLAALDQLLEGTQYQEYFRAYTKTKEEDLYAQRNLVILSQFPFVKVEQYKHDFTPAPLYQRSTGEPVATEPKQITWERPILHATIDAPVIGEVHLINLHLKSKNPSNIPGEKVDNYTWKSASGWAEGFYISDIQRVGQALETRTLIDKIFDKEAAAHIVVAGDFNADCDEVPVETILGRIENTNNPDLTTRVLIPAESSVPEESRYSLLHRGHKNMLDHILISQSLLPYYQETEIHNETLSDESIAFATDDKYPGSDHAAVIAQFSA